MSFTSTDLFIEILRIGIVLMQKVESTAADAAYSRTSTHNIHLHVCCRPDRSISGEPIDQHLERVVTKSHQKKQKQRHRPPACRNSADYDVRFGSKADICSAVRHVRVAS